VLNDVIRIGLVMTHSLAFFRDILRGVKSFAMERPEWIFTPISPDKRALELAQPLRCDGYLAHIYSQPLADALLSLGKPVINVSGVLPDLPCPRVVVDHVEVGRQAARHLLQRGVLQFGFVGYPQHQFSLERERGFREIVAQAGFTVHAFHERAQRIQDPTGLWTWNQPLMNWLTELPKPAGILTSHDTQGAQASEYCRQLHFRVPDDVAIVGVDDDDLLCELARPSLSSVAVPGERIGYEAARLLDKCLSGTASAETVIVLPPGEVVVRQSSDLLAVTDLDVRAAVSFIHEHAHLPIRVPDVLKVVPVARRGLERRFRKSLNCSISEEIRRAHLDRSRKLLLGTDLPIATVATLSGFQDGRQLSIVFRAETGVTPTDFRHQFRLRS
jgi:LacI family transcriptional regulator